MAFGTKDHIDSRLRTRNRVRCVFFVILCLSLLMFSSFLAVADLIAQTNIPSSGFVYYRFLTIILRNKDVQTGVPSNINNWVDSYVSNHSYATAITISDMHQYGVWWYGYSFKPSSGTWMGWTFVQLKTLIDRFHYHGWRVGLETTGIAWNSQQESNYIKNNHNELAFTDANGMRATGIDNSGNYEKNPGSGNVIPDWFAKFTSDDPTNGITAGSRLLDVYTARLKQMILDGLQWDFWFGTDGWNGFNLQGYNWNSATKSNCYSFGLQEENEWGNWTSASMLPSNWGSLNNIQRADAITQNSTRLNNWWYYWQVRFAQMYAQIRQVFIDAGRPGPFYLIGTADMSSEPENIGNLGPTGMWNMTLLDAYNSVDYFYDDVESTERVGANYAIGREAAYVGAVTKMQSSSIKPIIGLQPVYWTGIKRPVWEVKQSYLAQATNYVWYNGTRYRVSDPTIIMMQYPNDTGWLGWTKQEEDDLFEWIQKMAYLLKSAEPVWLGPVYPIPDLKSGTLGSSWAGINFTFSQWLWTRNIYNKPQFINESMGTFFLDEALGDSGPDLQGLYNRMVNEMWGTKKLNLWYYECRGMDWTIGKVWNGYGSEAANSFGITYSQGSSASYTVLSGLTDPVASWIASGYEGTTYLIDAANQYSYHGVYLPSSGLVNIVSFASDSPNRIAAGYFKNSSSSNFLLTHMPSGDGSQNYKQILPRSMINKMLYWVSNCPVNSSEPLIDLKVMNSSGAILIPMSNQRDVGSSMGSGSGWEISSVLTIDPNVLGLSNPSNYMVYWASGSGSLGVSSWSSVSISLKGMADILVIEPIA